MWFRILERVSGCVIQNSSFIDHSGIIWYEVFIHVTRARLSERLREIPAAVSEGSAIYELDPMSLGQVLLSLLN